MDILAIVLTLVSIAGAFALAVYLYFKIPNWLVRLFEDRTDERGHRRGRFTKVDPNHAKLVQRGGEIVRVLIGTNFYMAGDDLKDINKYEIKERTKDDENTSSGGGKLDAFVTVLEAWIFKITGYRVVGASLADFFGATIVTYDLNRPENMRHSMKGKDDMTDHVILSPQIYPFKVEKAETGKLIKMKGVDDQENDEDETRQRVPVDLSGKYTFQVRNLWKILYGTNFGYFQFVISTLQAGIRDQVQKLGIDDMFSNKVKNNVGIGILALNDDRRLKYDEVGIERGDIPVDKDGNPIKERPEPGTINGYGFQFVQVLIEDIDPDQGYLDDLAKQQKAILDQQANISRTELDVTVAGNELRAAEIRARATAAPHRERLTAIAAGGKEVQGLLRDHAMVRDVLVADRYSQGVEEAENGTIFVNAGAVGAPLPTFDVNPQGGQPPRRKRGGRNEGGKEPEPKGAAS